MTIDAANLLPIAASGELSVNSLLGAMPQTAEDGGFATAFVEQLGLLQVGLADVVKPVQLIKSADLTQLPTDTQVAMQNVAALFGKKLPQNGNLPQSIDLDDTMQTLADVMQQLQSLETPVKNIEQRLSPQPKSGLSQVTEGEPDVSASDPLMALLVAMQPAKHEDGEAQAQVSIRQEREVTSEDSQQSLNAKLLELQQQIAQPVAGQVIVPIDIGKLPVAQVVQEQSLSVGMPLLNQRSPDAGPSALPRKSSAPIQSLLADVGQLAIAAKADGAGSEFERHLAELLEPATSAPGEAVSSTKDGRNALNMAENLVLDRAGNLSAQATQPVGGEQPAPIDLVVDLNRLTQVLPNAAAPSGKSETVLASPFNSPQWNEDLGQKLIWMHKQALPSAELRLNPEHLGPVLVKIDQHQDQTSIVFTAQHQAVREAIESAIPKLREMFSNQQLQLSDVNVSQHQANAEQRQPREFFQNASSEQQRQTRGDAEGLEQASGESVNVAEEVESGRAVVGSGLLSLFA